MHISNTKIPAFPRSINRYKYTKQKISLRDRKPLLVKNIEKVRINQSKRNNSKLVFPELYYKRWFPFILDGKQLISIVPSMIGNLTDRRVAGLSLDWQKWLEKWKKINRLTVPFDSGVEPAKIPATKKKKTEKQRKRQEGPVLVPEVPEVPEDEEDEENKEKVNPLLWPLDV